MNSHIHILRTGPYEEIVRRPSGDKRWCFRCRKQRVFEYIVLAPIYKFTAAFAGDFLAFDGLTTQSDTLESQCSRVEYVELPWYGPIRKVECSVCHLLDGDLFPGHQREWDD